MKYQADVVIAGAGLAGLIAAYDLLTQGKKVLIFDKDKQENSGGLAKLSFGGVTMIDTPYQRRMGLQDSPELCYRDWESFAQWSDGPEWHWPKKWAKFYCENSIEYIYEPLDRKKIKFLPLVNWPERGMYQPGNSLPRWHITWGTGLEIIVKLLAALEAHPLRGNLQVYYDHEVSDITVQAGRVVGVEGKSMLDGSTYTAAAPVTILATGGMCGGDLSVVRKHWFKEWGEAPKKMLNGAHIYGDAMLHFKAQKHGANLTHLDKQWHYAAGIHRPGNKRPDDGISIVPPRSALWMDAHGRRVGPQPLVGNTDTRWVVEQICKLPGQYTWQIMNWKIAAKEMAITGSDYMVAFKNKSYPLMFKHLLFGNHDLVRKLTTENVEDIATADSLPQLVAEMQKRSLYGLQVDAAGMEADIRAYDQMIDRGPTYHNDDQLRRIANFRNYRGDKIRLCNFQKILDPKAGKLIAIREFVLARKSLGGMQTDLQSRVLRADGSVMDGLYAVGEAAGFGGGGIHGHGSLEGTFLGGCVLTATVAARSIAKG